MRRFLRWGLVLAGAGTIAVAAFLFGFVHTEKQWKGYWDLRAALSALEQRTMEAAGGPPPVDPGVRGTHLIDLQLQVATVDTGRDADPKPGTDNPYEYFVTENGGGLTSFGDDVLLLPYDGRIYAASSPDDFRPTDVRAPDNGRAAYQAAAEMPKYQGYDFRKGYLRYNDILHAETPEGAFLVASYTENHPDRECYTNTLARLPLPAGAGDIEDVSAGPDDWTVFYRTAPCMPFKDRYAAMEGHMAGGRVAFRAPGTVLLSSGDFHLDGMRSDGAPVAQDPAADYGKVIAVDLSGGDARTLSTGHRNPQGITVAPDGRILLSEHGPRGGDELNLIREGANYGWPRESYGTAYARSPIPAAVSYARHQRHTPPAYAWLPSPAISNLVVLQGFHPAWDGDVLLGSLKDQSLFRVRMTGGQAVYSERIEIGSRIRYVHQHTDGRVVLWTDNQELIFISAIDPPDFVATVEDYLEDSGIEGRAAERVTAALEGCAECHSIGATSEAAPGLAAVYGDPVAATGYQGYSAALSGMSATWTEDNLRAYLSDPQGFAPGTSMPDPGIPDEPTLDAVVGFLRALDQRY